MWPTARPAARRNGWAAAAAGGLPAATDRALTPPLQPPLPLLTTCRTGTAPLVVTSVTLRLSCAQGPAAFQVALFNADQQPTTALTAWADGAYPSTCGDGAPYSAVAVGVGPVALQGTSTYALVGRTAGFTWWGASTSDLDAAAAAAASGWASLGLATSGDAGTFGGLGLRACLARPVVHACNAARPRRRP